MLNLLLIVKSEMYSFPKMKISRFQRSIALIREDQTLDIVKYSCVSDMRCNTFLSKQVSLAGKLTETCGDYCKDIRSGYVMASLKKSTGEPTFDLLHFHLPSFTYSFVECQADTLHT